VPESVESWWRRRRWSKEREIPYDVGTFRVDWERYPVLVRQYHPDLNFGVTLTQVPPGADVYLQWQCDAGHIFVATPLEQRSRPGQSRRRSTWCPECSILATGRSLPRPRRRSPSRQLAAPHRQPGTAFFSAAAPKPASAAEAAIRHALSARLDVDLTVNAVVVAQPFFDRWEVWPDIPIDELKVAIEYDTTGRDGLEHVGKREQVDLRKDRLLRRAGWEVVRIRCGKLRAIGPYDILASGPTKELTDRIIDMLCAIRGDLIVRSYFAEHRLDQS
jgi:hypothetical protein